MVQPHHSPLPPLQILAWGLRGLQSYNLLSVMAPSLVVECGGEAIQTAPIRDLHENPNFPINVFLMRVHLPMEEDLMPPIELKVVDNREFGYKPVVGQASVRSLRQYMCEPSAEGHHPSLRLHFPLVSKAHAALPSVLPQEEEECVDWWSKFYAATGDLAKSGGYLQTGLDSLKVYNCELEAVPEFQGLQDFCQTFRLYRGRVLEEASEDPLVVGEFKGLFQIYPLPEDPSSPPPPRQFQELPESQPQKCLVRVYIVRAFNLPPKDRNGLCDPYVRVTLGKKKLGDRDQYLPNTLEPVFGRVFELPCTLPLEKDLQISLFDYDLILPDQKIGATSIDLENRLLSRFRANCGLPQSYCISGPCQWRDQLLPTQLLENFARMRTHAPCPSAVLGFPVSESKVPAHGHLGPPRERLALHLLRTCGLVPEHLETRTLYHSIQPGIDQGKLQMWVDIFPESFGPPGPAFNITPRMPKRYELRCVVWNTRDVDLRDTSITGQRMSDIYVKGWLDGLEEERQRTDVHYRSLGGEGNFNWRFIFPFEFLPMEQVCVLPEKQHLWSLDETVLKVPPKLILQVWDNDKFSADDFLGVLEIKLLSMPCPARRPRACTLKMLQDESDSPTPPRFPRRTSLFKQRLARGWWPCVVQEEGRQRLSGKIELTLELLTDKEAEERPAGKGREEPNMNPTLHPPVGDFKNVELYKGKPPNCARRINNVEHSQRLPASTRQLPTSQTGVSGWVPTEQPVPNPSLPPCACGEVLTQPRGCEQLCVPAPPCPALRRSRGGLTTGPPGLCPGAPEKICRRAVEGQSHSLQAGGEAPSGS
uniref:C2 domain-containing protein n=1 Tax=Terrapene triunguis TaxID=2587831 RepID=A0A674IB99_9SAUR